MRRRLISYLSSLNVDNMTPIIIANYTDFGSADIFKNTLENYTGYSSNADFLMSYLILAYARNASAYVHPLEGGFEFCNRYLPKSENAGTAGSQMTISSGGGQNTFQVQPCVYIHTGDQQVSYNSYISYIKDIYFLKDGRVYASATGNDIPSNSSYGYTQVYRLK